MKIMSPKHVLALTVFAVFVTGCKTLDPYTREEKTSSATKGALIGAAAGAGDPSLVADRPPPAKGVGPRTGDASEGRSVPQHGVESEAPCRRVSRSARDQTAQRPGRFDC